jgi:predicted RNase H-like HicB family nuclease
MIYGMIDPVRRYHIDLFYSSDDECWIANVPDLQGCSAHGETAADAAREVRVAMELWLDGWLDDHEDYPPAKWQPNTAGQLSKLPQAKAG